MIEICLWVSLWFVSFLFIEYYRFWLKSFDSHSDPSSQVIIVGTHAEGMSKTVSDAKSLLDFIVTKLEPGIV